MEKTQLKWIGVQIHKDCAAVRAVLPGCSTKRPNVATAMNIFRPVCSGATTWAAAARMPIILVPKKLPYECRICQERT